ncbi:MAG: hypothetical protein LBO69_05565 [Ignavibacteria bacterium]|jgi:hypothetical protein|nr:hypothetical protein [Ignavibacteria bacterium]
MNLSGTRIEADKVNIIKEVKRQKRAKQHRRTPNGEIGAEKSHSFAKNLRMNANRHLLKSLALGAVGAVTYPLIPTVMQAVTKSDWNGYKGLITGVATASLLGLATGEPAITVGACSAAGTHLLYSKCTGAIERMTGTQIFRMHPENVIYRDQLNEALAQPVLSDGKPPQSCTSCGK